MAKKTAKKAAKKAAKKTAKKTAKPAAKKTAKRAAKKPAKNAAKQPAAAPAKPKKASESGVIEEIVLNWADLSGAKTGATSYGSNKFYKATLVESAPGVFVVTFNYGRVGTSGQTQRQTFGDLDQASRALNRKVQSKISKGYSKIEMRTEEDERQRAIEKGIEFEKPKKAVKSNRVFHPQVAALLKIMYTATGKAIKSGLSSSSGVTDEAPLGNLHDIQLDRGADILQDLEDLLGKKRKPSRQKLIDLTNDYLSNIPRDIDFARSGSKLDIDAILLNSAERIQKEREFLTLLRDAHLAKDVFAAASLADDPVEIWYNGLNCALEFVDPKSNEFSQVQAYFDKGQSPMNSNFFEKLRVNRIWTLEREGENKGFEEYSTALAGRSNATGVIPGWHGTRTENLMGISRSGLLMPENLPKGVQITGKAFGMGIYHAPCWPDAGEPKKEKGKTFCRYNGALKSMNYTSIGGAYWNSASSGTSGYLFLEELALGIPEVHLTACWDRKRPAKGKDYIYAKAFGNDQLSHDEVVTFDENASRMTHLLEIVHK